MRLLLSTLALASFTNVALGSPSTTLYSRQLNIPPDCQNTCSPVTPLLSERNCTPDQCCTEQFVTSLRDCLLCIGTVEGIQDYTQPQGTLDQFISSCAAQGRQVPRVTLPGQDNNRSSSSFDPSTIRPSSTSATQTPTQTSPSTPAQSPPAQTTSNNNNNAGVSGLNVDTKGLSVVVLGMMLGAARIL